MDAFGRVDAALLIAVPVCAPIRVKPTRQYHKLCRMAPDDAPDLKAGLEYWENTPATLDGVLGAA